MIAKVAKDMGILTVGIVTIPSRFEGPKRLDQAREGVKRLKEHVDSLIIIDNERYNGYSDRRHCRVHLPRLTTC